MLKCSRCLGDSYMLDKDGNEYEGDRNWQGELKGIAIYNRFVSPEEAARKYELMMAK